jgi:hypothetical protein
MSTSMPFEVGGRVLPVGRQALAGGPLAPGQKPFGGTTMAKRRGTGDAILLPYARMRAQTIHGGVRELHGRARELATFLPSGPRRSYNPSLRTGSSQSQSLPGQSRVQPS